MDSHFTMPSGNRRPISSVAYDPLSNRFFYGSFDVTGYLSIEQKLFIAPHFDRERANLEAYEESYRDEHGGEAPPPTGSTSVLENFGDNLSNEAFGGPGTVIRNLQKTGLVIAGILILVLIFQSGVLKK